MSLKLKQVELFNFINKINEMNSCNDAEYDEIIELLIQDLPNDSKKIDHLEKTLVDFRRFYAVLSKHLMVTKNDIRRDFIKKEKEQPNIIKDETYDITNAALILGISRPTLYKKIEQNLIKTVMKGKKEVITKTELDKYRKENYLV